MEPNNQTVSVHATNRLIKGIILDATEHRVLVGVNSVDDEPFSFVARRNPRREARAWSRDITQQQLAEEMDQFISTQGKTEPTALNGRTLQELVDHLQREQLLSSQDHSKLDIVSAYGKSGRSDPEESKRAMVSIDSLIDHWSTPSPSDDMASPRYKLEAVKLLTLLRAAKSNIEAIHDPNNFDWNSMSSL